MPRRELSMASKSSLDAYYQPAVESPDAPADAAR
jgi:hypothetical protein